MTQYLYLLKRYPRQPVGSPLEVVGEIVEPKSSAVLDFLDKLVDGAGSTTDRDLKVSDLNGPRVLQGRLVDRKKLSAKAIRTALVEVPELRDRLTAFLEELSKRPERLFDFPPKQRSEWSSFRELLEVRTLLQQARAKSGFAIALCHD